MSLNSTPSSERVHIGFFGRRNAGKSSVVNQVTGQELSVVSDIKGTTTDPVTKAMELLPMGPVQIIDTPGIDDEGSLGELRVRKTKQILNRTDAAVLVIDSTAGITKADRQLIDIFAEKEIPYLIALNKADLLPENGCAATAAAEAAAACSDCRIPPSADQFIPVSAAFNTGISYLKECIAQLTASEESQRRIVGDLLSPSDFAVLVVPIDSAAPKGRLILPQQQTIRDILEAGAARHRHQRKRTAGYADRSGQKTTHRHHRQSGIRPGQRPDAGRHRSDLFLYSDGALQRYASARSKRRRSHRNSEGQRPGSDLRRLHSPPAVRRYRFRENPPMAERLYGKRHRNRTLFRQRISGRPLTLPSHPPLRRLYAQRT